MSGGGQAKHIGNWGEALAAEYLRKQGYRLLATNYRCRAGEIDLIASKGKVLAFVEVKTRQDNRLSTGRAAVNTRKQHRIMVAALDYLSHHPALGLQPRFDVAEVIAPQGIQTKNPELLYLESAFLFDESNATQTGGRYDGYTPF